MSILKKLKNFQPPHYNSFTVFEPKTTDLPHCGVHKCTKCTNVFLVSLVLSRGRKQRGLAMYIHVPTFGQHFCQTHENEPITTSFHF